MTMKINVGNTAGSSLTIGNIIGKIVLTSVRGNRASAVMTVKNYHTEADAQMEASKQKVQDVYDEQADNIKEWNKEHRHKKMHKIFGAIFHAIRIVVHLCQPRKLVKSVKNVVKKVIHPKSTVKSLLHLNKIPSLTKGLVKEEAKRAGKTKMAKVSKFAEKTANWGEVGLAAYDGVGKVQISKLKNDIENIQIAKSVCDNNYDMLESEKKQELQTISDRLSDVNSTLNTASQMINRQSSMQSQIVNCI